MNHDPHFILEANDWFTPTVPGLLRVDSNVIDRNYLDGVVVLTRSKRHPSRAPVCREVAERTAWPDDGFSATGVDNLTHSAKTIEGLSL